MLDMLMKLNDLKPVDTWFFIICAVMVGAIVGIYFLIPVLNQKQYREQRENLKKREQAFKSNALLQQDPVSREEKAELVSAEEKNADNAAVENGGEQTVPENDAVENGETAEKKKPARKSKKK